MRHIYLYISLVIGFLAVEKTFGQGGLQGALQGRGSSAGGLGNLALDTSDIYYFYADHPNQIFAFDDSLLTSFHQYDPIRLADRHREYDFANLGNLGSAARPLFFQPTWRRGFDVGLHQFDIYQMRTGDVRYHKITQAYTQAGYTQGPTQADAQFNVRFSRNFADGLNLSLEHRRINNAGSYDFQKATNSNVAAGMWYRNKFGNYDGFLSYVTNSVQQENNGGVAEPLDDTFIPPFQVQVNLRTANTRYANNELAYTQYFYLNRIFSDASVQRRENRQAKRETEKEQRRQAKIAGKTALANDSTAVLDSLKTPTSTDSISKKEQPRPSVIGPARQPDTLKTTRPTTINGQPTTINNQPTTINGQRVFTLYHQIAWRTETYKFADTAPDSAFYGSFLTDSRGLRHYLEVKKLENTFKLQTFKLREQPASGTTGRPLPQEQDLLELGLVHSVNFVQQEPVDTQAIHNVFLTGQFQFSPGERLRAQVYAHLGVGANAGDFRLDGELFLNLKKAGSLRLEAVNQLYEPSLLPQRFYVSEREIWKNGFGKTLETSLSGTYSLPVFHFSVTGQYHLLNNFVYFDSTGQPRQSGAFSVVQLMARKDFHFGPVHLENWAGLQQTTSDVLPLPQFYTKHSLYFQQKIFKKVMLTKAGIDARLASGFTPPAYHPLTGQFYLQTLQTLQFTPLLDAFLSFRVKTFRFFFKVENLLPFFTEKYYYQTAGQPLPFGFGNGGLRLGIDWRLVD